MCLPQDYRIETNINEIHLSAEIISALQTCERYAIKTDKLVTLKIVFKDGSDIFYKVNKSFYKKYIKQLIN